VARKKKNEDKDDELKSGSSDSKADPEKNWASKPESKAYEQAKKLYPLIVKQFQNQEEQSDRIEEYWNILNAMPDSNLQYNGNTQGYVPVVRDCINARTKRTAKQLFPVNHKYVDGISSDGLVPFTQLSLLHHYIRKARLKSIVRSDLIAGDVTGQWNLMIDWLKTKRTVTKLVKRNSFIEQIDGEDVKDLEIEDPNADEEEETEEEDVVEEGVEIVDFATEDLAVIPPTCNNLQRAKAVCVRLRLSKEAVEDLVEEGAFVLPEGTEIADFCDKADSAKDKRDRPKKQAEDAGVKAQGTRKYALIFMAYAKLDLGGEAKESAIIYFAGADEILGIIKNPLWSGKIPILSEPIDRVAGSFFGKSKIEPVKFMQWNLCDFWNMGQDSAMYSLLPIFAADPLKTPNWAQLVMGLAAVWPIAPADVKTITFPQLWKDSAGIVDLMKRQIWESMDVNEMMMGKMPAGRKNNQLMGQMQQEQATNITDHAERYEEVMLNPLVEFIFEFDQQYRTKEVMIEARGELGVQAAVKTIPVQQWGEHFFFRWAGTSYQNNMQRMQMQIGFINVLKGFTPQMLNGRKLDFGPFAEAATENIFGPEIAPKILIDERNMFTVDPNIENEMLNNGFHAQVHEADNHQEHLQAHMMAANLTKDPLGLYREHMGAHMMAIQAKREKEMAAGKGMPGAPGGGGPGAAGAPKPGAQPAPGGPRPAQSPPGAVQTDNMQGAPGRG
jgi:hypothetical protein